MKRIFIVIIVLIIGLSIALSYRLDILNDYLDAPAGGTGIIEGTEINITARIPARIVSIQVREGDEVKAGQMLVELECDEPKAVLAQAKAQLAAAEASVQTALAKMRAAAGNTLVAKRTAKAAAAEAITAKADRANLDKEAQRIRSLYKSGSIPSSKLETVETHEISARQRVEIVAANIEAAKARISTSQQGKLAAEAQVEAANRSVEALRAAVLRAQSTVDECRLVSPREAVVQTCNYEPGEVVLPGANVLSLVYLDQVKATFYLPNTELAAAAPRKRVTLIADAYPGRKFKGSIEHVSAKAEFTPKNVQTREDRNRLVYAVEVAVPNSKRQLRPGMPVEVFIDGTEK